MTYVPGGPWTSKLKAGKDGIAMMLPQGQTQRPSFQLRDPRWSPGQVGALCEVAGVAWAALGPISRHVHPGAKNSLSGKVTLA